MELAEAEQETHLREAIARVAAILHQRRRAALRPEPCRSRPSRAVETWTLETIESVAATLHHRRPQQRHDQMATREAQEHPKGNQI